MLEGEHLVGVYAERRGAPEVLVVADDCLESSGRARRCAARFAERTLVVPAAAVRRDRDAAGRRRHPGGRRRRRAPAPSPPAGFCLLLDDVQDPGNVGSMLRSAAAAGVAQVLLSRRCAFAWSPKVLRAGTGRALPRRRSTRTSTCPRGRAAFRRDGRQRASPPSPAAGRRSTTPRLARPRRPRDRQRRRGPVAGAGRGGDARVTIPMPGGMESLNAAAAAAVCLFECVRQRR